MTCRIERKKELTVDICRTDYIKSVRCDRPCSDGYEVTNLVSNTLFEKTKGFLAERFIRPPVTIDFKFTCEVEIRYIAVICNVGAQKTSGLELLSQSRPNNAEYQSIGSGVLEESKKGFVFYKRDEPVADKFGEHYFFRTFKSVQSLAANRLRVKIFRTRDKSVPALGRIEIWGIPCKPILSANLSNSRYKSGAMTVGGNEEIKAHPKTKLDSFSISKSPYQALKHNHNQSVSNLNLSSSISIPEDFIDPITCEIMTQPVILPSGKVIDNLTLELHHKAEMQWGREPSDPFTGLILSSFNKPVAATDLKCRIDRFLTENSDNVELHNIPRTVGRCLSMSSKQSSYKPGVSKLINLSGSLRRPATDCPAVVQSCLSKPPVVKRKKMETVGCPLSTESSGNVQSYPYTSTDNRKKAEASLSLVATKCSGKIVSFEEKMQQSLEKALKSTLSKLPKLTGELTSPLGENCVFCQICKSCDNLFSITCSHYICRSCLINSKQKEPLKCMICSSSYKPHDVQRIHLR